MHATEGSHPGRVRYVFSGTVLQEIISPGICSYFVETVLKLRKLACHGERIKADE